MNGGLDRLFAVFLLFFVTIPGGAIVSTTVVPATAETTIWGFDRSFGNNGFVYFQPPKFVDGNFWYPYFRTFLLPDGRILVNLEYLFDYGEKDYDNGLLALRYEPQGELETAIDAFGLEYAWVIGIQPDGKMIASISDLSNRSILKRYKDDFSVDPTFVFPDRAQLKNAYFSEVQPDGRILLADDYNNGAVRRLNSDGSLDNTFLDNIGPFYMIDEIASHTDGNFLVEGHELGLNISCFARVYSNDGAYIGSLYESDNGSQESLCSFVKFAPYPDGGFVWSFYGESLYKAKPDTSWDLDFGDAGKVELDLGPGNEVVTVHLPLVSQPDGKILIVGLVENLSGTWPFVARFNSDGSQDTSFGNLGVFTIYLPSKSNWMDDDPEILLQEDGKIVVAAVSADHFILVRLQEYSINDWVYLPLVR